MRKYEVMYILRPDVEQEAVDAIAERFNEIITSGGGEITKHEVLGKKRLAYEIKKFRDGIYVQTQFTCEPSVVAELERIIRITDEVIRHLVVRDVA